jgi:hypothetical protein
MKKLATLLAVAALCTGTAIAQEKKEMTEQQKRMQSCNAEAKKREFKDNSERQTFMSACLKGEMPAQAQGGGTAQQQRMKDCNAQAGKQQFPSGRERQAFMSQCLRGN